MGLTGAGDVGDGDVFGIGAVLNLETHGALDAHLHCLDGGGEGGVVGPVARSDDVVALEAGLDDTRGLGALHSGLGIEAVENRADGATRIGVGIHVDSQPQVVSSSGIDGERLGGGESNVARAGDGGSQLLVGGEGFGCAGVEQACRGGAAADGEREVVEADLAVVALDGERDLDERGIAAAAHHLIGGGRCGRDRRQGVGGVLVKFDLDGPATGGCTIGAALEVDRQRAVGGLTDDIHRAGGAAIDAHTVGRAVVLAAVVDVEVVARGAGGIFHGVQLDAAALTAGNKRHRAFKSL